MELINQFGIDLRLLAAQIVNFIIILYLLRKFAYRPILELLKKREETIKEGLESAKKGQEILEKALLDEKNVLKKAQTQATQIVDDAKNQSLQILKDSIGSAKKQREIMLQDAKDQIELEVKKAQESLGSYVGELAIKLLDRSLKNFFSQKEQKELMRQALKQIEK